MDIAGPAVGTKAPWDESPISEAYVIGQKEPSTQIMMAVVRRTEVARSCPRHLLRPPPKTWGGGSRLIYSFILFFT